MKYQHSKTESSEYLRRALPLMSNQDAGLHPISYAVWYEYVSGMNVALNAAADKLLTSQGKLSERDVIMLFERYVADVSEEAASTFAAGFQRILGDISHSTTAASDEAGAFGDTLQRLSDSGDMQRPEGIAELMQSAQSMRTSVSTLQNKLDDSRREIESLRVEVARAREASRTDGLTGLVNRKSFDEVLASCLADVSNPDASPCLLMCDIDHFKKINDTYGHVFGDKVIRAVANVIKENVKGRDTAARYGGEEFVILLPETSQQGAEVLAEQIRHAIERGRIKRGSQDETVARITLSLGVARYQPGEPPTRFIERADQALYAAKQGGRNRVNVAGV